MNTDACYSEIQADAIYQHIDCVIGLNRPIGDIVVNTFYWTGTLKPPTSIEQVKL